VRRYPGWLKELLDQGKAMPFRSAKQVQMRKAEMEQYMMQQGQMVIPDYYDDDFMHIQVHRMAEMEHAGIPNSQQYVQLSNNIQMHAQNAAMKKPGMGQAVPQPGRARDRGPERADEHAGDGADGQRAGPAAEPQGQVGHDPGG
jgi:hypothetical protein